MSANDNGAGYEGASVGTASLGVLPGLRPRDADSTTASLRRQSDELAGAGDWGAAAEDVNRRLLGLDPAAVVAMTRLAKCLRTRGDATGAEEVYGSLMTVDPGNVIAANFLRGLRREREQVIAQEREAATADRKRAFARRPAVRAVSEPEMETLLDALRALPDAAGTYLEGDLLTNIFLTVLDLNMQPTTVSKAIRHYRRHRSGELWSLPDLQGLLECYPDNTDGNRQIAQFLWANRYANRVEWMRGLVDWLVAKDLTSGDKLRAWMPTADFDRDFKDQVKGLDIAAYNGLIIRLGADTVKPDILLHEYVEALVGHRVTDEEVVRVMHAGAKRLKRHPVQLDWSLREQKRGRAGIL
jgi:hypothetical protein